MSFDGQWHFYARSWFADLVTMCENDMLVVDGSEYVWGESGSRRYPHFTPHLTILDTFRGDDRIWYQKPSLCFFIHQSVLDKHPNFVKYLENAGLEVHFEDTHPTTKVLFSRFPGKRGCTPLSKKWIPTKEDFEMPYDTTENSPDIYDPTFEYNSFFEHDYVKVDCWCQEFKKINIAELIRTFFNLVPRIEQSPLAKNPRMTQAMIHLAIKNIEHNSSALIVLAFNGFFLDESEDGMETFITFSENIGDPEELRRFMNDRNVPIVSITENRVEDIKTQKHLVMNGMSRITLGSDVNIWTTTHILLAEFYRLKIE